ncbi:hypothetical protein SH449x_002683 [Pirellulaceae bacterium SH449]
MPTYNPKKLGEPEVIREINPTVLCTFLKPFEGYLRTRGLEVREPSRIDNATIEKLVDILINPTMKTPQALLNAVFYVEEMSSPLAADSLLKLARQAGMPFDENGKHSLADVVMQVWLFDSKMVEAQHAWQTWKTPRLMECFQPVQSAGIAPITITEDRLNQAIKDAGDWFAKHNRGRKLFMTPRVVDNEIQISIQRGDPFRRKPTIDEDGMDTVTFREARKDTMIYDLSEEVLMLNSSLKSTYPVYCRIFGNLLFDDPQYFGIYSRYTLAPLSELGEDALSPGEIDAIEEIVLLNYRVRLGGPFNRYIIHGADDFFADLKWRGGTFHAEGPLDRANFRIKYRHVKARRALTLYTGSEASYTRDEHSRHIEDWLLLRRFVMKTGARAAKGSNKYEPTVASY